MGLPVIEPTTYRGTNARSFFRVQCVHIQAKMDGDVVLPNGINGLLHYVCNTTLIDVGGGKHMDLMSTKEHFLAWINIACADDSDASRIDFRSPATDIDKLTIAQASQSSEDHPVYIAGRSRLFSIEIRMGVDPEHSQLPMYTGNSTDGTQCNAMITSQNQRELTILQSSADETSQFFGYMYDGLQVF